MYLDAISWAEEPYQGTPADCELKDEEGGSCAAATVPSFGANQSTPEGGTSVIKEDERRYIVCQ